MTYFSNWNALQRAVAWLKNSKLIVRIASYDTKKKLAKEA
jgi:hypothetical protein